MLSVAYNQIGFDMDGIIVSDYPEWAHNLLKKTQRLPMIDLWHFAWMLKTKYCLPLFRPHEDCKIITARLETRRKLTQKWLDKYGIDCKLFMRSDRDIGQNESKVLHCLENNIKIFYESDANNTNEMRRLFLDKGFVCSVVHWAPRIERILLEYRQNPLIQALLAYAGRASVMYALDPKMVGEFINNPLHSFIVDLVDRREDGEN